jgi:hypothetical protein
MKTKLITTLVAVLGAFALAANAQDNNPPNDGPPQGGGPGQGMRGQRPPMPALVKALDANHDGVIDADEIANASTALKTLDKNGDGKLTRDEFMGPRPQMRGGQGQQGGGDHPDGPPPGANDGGHDAPPSGPPGDK